jgi:hypothetical protein
MAAGHQRRPRSATDVGAREARYPRQPFRHPPASRPGPPHRLLAPGQQQVQASGEKKHRLPHRAAPNPPWTCAQLTVSAAVVGIYRWPSAGIQADDDTRTGDHVCSRAKPRRCGSPRPQTALLRSRGQITRTRDMTAINAQRQSPVQDASSASANALIEASTIWVQGGHEFCRIPNKHDPGPVHYSPPGARCWSQLRCAPSRLACPNRAHSRSGPLVLCLRSQPPARLWIRVNATVSSDVARLVPPPRGRRSPSRRLTTAFPRVVPPSWRVPWRRSDHADRGGWHPPARFRFRPEGGAGSDPAPRSQSTRRESASLAADGLLAQ